MQRNELQFLVLVVNNQNYPIVYLLQVKINFLFCFRILLDDNSVDLVAALDFIEHIVDPENFARECFRVLKPGGEVFINTPNIQFWQHILTLIGGKMPHTSGDKEVYHGGHLAFFTYEDMKEIFGNAGFESEDQIVDEEGYTPAPDWIVDQWIKTGIVRSQIDFVREMNKFCNPNLLYKAVKK
jgi:predicted SAM-dependent methyltransferase